MKQGKTVLAEQLIASREASKKLKYVSIKNRTRKPNPEVYLVTQPFMVDFPEVKILDEKPVPTLYFSPGDEFKPDMVIAFDGEIFGTVTKVLSTDTFILDHRLIVKYNGSYLFDFIGEVEKDLTTGEERHIYIDRGWLKPQGLKRGELSCVVGSVSGSNTQGYTRQLLGRLKRQPLQITMESDEENKW